MAVSGPESEVTYLSLGSIFWRQSNWPVGFYAEVWQAPVQNLEDIVFLALERPPTPPPWASYSRQAFVLREKEVGEETHYPEDSHPAEKGEGIF